MFIIVYKATEKVVVTNSLVNETQNLTRNVLSSGFFMVHDTSRGGQDDVTELSGWQQVGSHFSMSPILTLNLGEITPHLFNLPFSWTTILPDLWSSMYSNSPM